ncbi:MAG: amidohydrolase family protein [Pseudomonadota bacterium]
MHLMTAFRDLERGAERASRRAAFLTAWVCLLPLSSVPAAAATVVHAGWLFDSASGRMLTEQTVVIDAGKVVARGDGFDAPGAADELIDLSDATVMPGWIDMHVHLDGQLSPASYAERFRLEPADAALRGAAYAERTVMAGFTTVRDLGTADNVAQSLRDAIAAGYIVGPRVFTAGKSLATTGGHADPSNGVNSSLRGDPGPAEGVVNSAADAYKAVRQRYKEGSDLIKLTATGGVLSQAKSGQNPQFTPTELNAIIAAAKDYGFKVAAHAHGSEGMRRAVAAGVDSIEHGTFMTPEIMRLMKRKGTWYVPTIMAGNFVALKAEEPGYFSELVRPKARAVGPQIQGTFAAAYEAGVNIAFGTDTGVSAHGNNWQEFLLMIEAGMPVLAALTSATKSAAQLLGQWEYLGSLDIGKAADLVAVPGDIRTDPQLFGKVSFVMKEGERIK